MMSDRTTDRCIAMPTVHAGEVDLYYELHGEGSPVVLINGWGSSSEMWSPFWKDLASSHEVVLFDNRGTGRSTKSDAPFSIRTLADDVSNLMDTIKIPKAHVLGASMGGMVALELALSHPEKVRSLILCMTSFGGPHSVQTPLEVKKKMITAMNPLGVISKRKAMRIWWSLHYTPDYVKENSSHLAEQAKTIKYPTPSQTYMLQAEAIEKFDCYDRLFQIRVPTFVMHGENDGIMPPENARIIAQSIPGARLKIFKGAAHAFTAEQRQETVSAILDFLSRIENLPIPAEHVPTEEEMMNIIT